MKIKGLTIRNFRSLREVHMEDLGNLIILIGENNSGKTNILEALNLFLASFDAFLASAYRRPLSQDDWYWWFSGNTDASIEFQITLEELSESEIKKLTEVTNHKQEGDLVVNRSILCKKESLYFQNDLIRWGSIASKREKDKYSAEGVEFNLDSFTQVVDRLLKESFNYISLDRENKPMAAHDSILDPAIRGELIKEGEDGTPQGMKKWNRDRQKYVERGWTSTQLECKGGRLFLPKETISLPYELEGGGYQAFLNMLRKIETGGDIFAIEEPENHLHPDLQKRFIKEMEQLLDSKKQVFIATHSPFIIDLVNLRRVWFIYLDGLESKAVNISTQEELSNIFRKIGIKPSDFLFANGVLIVEGSTDRDVYECWAWKIGKPFEKAHILVIDAEAAGNIKKYLASEVVQQTSFKRFGLCDKNAEGELRKAVEGTVPDKNIFALKKGDLEDYYPRGIVLQFAQEWGKKKGEAQQIPSEIKEGETVKKLNALLGQDWWKKPLADKVIKEMKPEQIDDEIKTKLTCIYDAV